MSLDEEYTTDWFLNIKDVIHPKKIESLVDLWEAHQLPKQYLKWAETRGSPETSYATYTKLLKLGTTTTSSKETQDECDKLLSSLSDLELFGIVRGLHMKVHLQELDQDATEVTKQSTQKLILRSFLDFLTNAHRETNGNISQVFAHFEKFVNGAVLRLVSTVHPNETERSTNLLHYNHVFERFMEWKKDYEAIQHIDKFSSEYKIRRSILNGMRREIKSEIEGAWQSDQMRDDRIPVQSEGRRIMDRYIVIFKALPLIVKFVKQIAKEASLLYSASVYTSTVSEFNDVFHKYFDKTAKTRVEKCVAIKQAMIDLKLNPNIPRITSPILTFGTWKSGDRDGNPYVVASYSNLSFIEHKEFVLSKYLETVTDMVDNLTASLSHVKCTEALQKSVEKDRKIFPYIFNIKFREVYRAKLRFMKEKLTNTLELARQILKKAGESTQPLLGLSFPGPAGYNYAEELQEDILVLYNSLVAHAGKAQGRSQLQDFKILVETFGFHLLSVDFRQTSTTNASALSEYLGSTDMLQEAKFPKLKESEKREILLKLLTSDMEFNASNIGNWSKATKDTFQSLIIYADAQHSSHRCVGKFIISMTQDLSDLLVLMVLLKLVGMIQYKDGKLVGVVDISGLYETIGDLQSAPRIISDFLQIDLLRDYIVTQRNGNLTVMLGYSDSTRDGSNLASDANLISATFALEKVEQDFNQKHPERPVHLIFYRGRGDTIPRGFGGSIAKAIVSQGHNSLAEDHTEQNRFLRKYASLSSAIEHLNAVYSSHLTALINKPIPETPIFQKYFEFFGNLSFTKWNYLVRTKNGGLGQTYFDILEKYTILPILSSCNFASRPVCREGMSYNVENIRAIPFTMILAQMRDFSSGFYGVGTSFDTGVGMLSDVKETTLDLLYLIEKEGKLDQFLLDLKQGVDSPIIRLVKMVLGDDVKVQERKPQIMMELFEIYGSFEKGLNSVAILLLDLHDKKKTPLEVLNLMYKTYLPFQNSMDNKETALQIRNYRIVQEYTKTATEKEKACLEETEKEADLTRKWVLKINGQESLQQKSSKRNYDSPELYLLHWIQSHFLRRYFELKKSGQKTKAITTWLQMTILATSEGLGFGG